MKIFIEELFYALTGFVVVSFVLEMFFQRMILAYVNLNVVLLIWSINAIILLVINNKIKTIDG